MSVNFTSVRLMDGCCDWVGGLKDKLDSFSGNLGHVLSFEVLNWWHMLAVFSPLLSWTKSQDVGYQACTFRISWIQRCALWQPRQFPGRILLVLGQLVSLFLVWQPNNLTSLLWLLFATCWATWGVPGHQECMFVKEWPRRMCYGWLSSYTGDFWLV